jgi:predicted MFS family arabinose efflux permease
MSFIKSKFRMLYMAAFILFTIGFTVAMPDGHTAMWFALLTAILGMPIARMSDVRGRRIFCVLSGVFAMMTFAIFMFASDNMHWVLFLATMILMGLSWACVGGPMASRLVEHAGDEPEMASSLTNEAYYIGGAIGTALAALAFTIASGTDGIDIDSVTSAQFLSGITATAAILFIISLTIAVLSFIVKDEKRF